MFVTTMFVAGMVTISVLNSHQEMITIRTTTAATPTVDSTALISTNVTTTTTSMTTTTKTRSAMLLLCTYDPRNGIDFLLYFDTKVQTRTQLKAKLPG